jgi:hypothetical protein
VDNLSQIETQLKKRLAYPYKWGQKQNDYFDYQTNFIYRISSFDDLLAEIKTRFDKSPDHEKYFNYSLNRWYNFWSAHAVEKIFCSLPNVKPTIDEKDRLSDFTIDGVKFDHKTTVFPKAFGKPLKDAITNTGELIKWLYNNQSQEKRMHLKNRLYIVLYAVNGEHWKLKAEISLLKNKIYKYMIAFNPDYLMKFEFEEGEKTLADVIWIIR